MLITNATVVTWGEPNRVLPDHAVYIAEGNIADLGPRRELEERYAEAERLDARGQLLMPGNICAHTHFYGAYARGMRSEEHTSELQSRENLVCRLLLEKKKKKSDVSSQTIE